MDNDCLYNEEDILYQIANGDEQAFSVLVKKYSSVLYAHALMYLKNATVAEELVQDVFLSLWQHRHDLPGLHNFRGYIFVMVRNRVISEFRRKILLPIDLGDDDIELADANPAGSLETKELSEILQHAITMLPPRRQQVFKMSRLEGKSYEQIAAELEISKSSVNQHIVEALLFLRTYLRNQLPLLLLLSIPGFGE